LDSQVPESLTKEAAQTIQNNPNLQQKSGNKLFKYILLPKHNHLMQECIKGTVDEYQQIDQTMSQLFLDTLLLELNTMP
jgi:hypothetical protein